MISTIISNNDSFSTVIQMFFNDSSSPLLSKSVDVIKFFGNKNNNVEKNVSESCDSKRRVEQSRL